MSIIFDNTATPVHGDIGPVVGCPGNEAAMNAASWHYLASASSSTELVYCRDWLNTNSDAGLTVTISSNATSSNLKFDIHANAGNDTDNPDSLSVGSTNQFASSTPSVEVSIGDTVMIYDSNARCGTFTVPTFNTTTSGPTISIENIGRNITAQISNVSNPKQYFLTDNAGNVVGDSTPYINGTTTTSGTILYQAPVTTTAGAHVYAVKTGNPQVPQNGDLVLSQSLSGLNPTWSETWGLTSNTLTGTIDTPSGWVSGTETGLHPNDVISIKDINTDTQITDGSHTLGTGYNVQNLPINISGTISLTQTATYGLYITADNISQQIGSTYTYTPQYSVSNISWSTAVLNQVRVSFTQNNWTNETIELWKQGGSSAISTNSNEGSLLTYNMTSAADNGTYELKVGNTTLSPTGTFSYVTQQHNIVINPPGFTSSWSDDLASGGSTVTLNLKVSNTGGNSVGGYVYLWQTGNNTAVDSHFVVAHNTAVYAPTLQHTSATANTLYYVTIEGSNTQVLTHTTGSYYPYSISGSWGFSNNTVTYTYTQSNGSSEQVELFDPNGNSVHGPNSYSSLQQTLTWVMQDATTDGTYTVTPGGGLANITSPQQYNYVAPPPPPPQQPSVSYAPAKGGRKRRFPIISTQLFNRQRSVYSIGTTHHELAPQF